ncbi:purine-cytosine permease family protein [Kribbella sp.]|uniref:purine-cytosine permease family protein n=1 Tax=Kribbella sp. TaxID=1871183 RepID=UPI002D687F64|nr:cytosine permease [Kribbella sp.]HZX08496.1 cytosine permease [Kribbella sp.]
MSTTSDSTRREALEHRTIEHIPVDERHGRWTQLFTIWFGSNIMLLTVATGVLATAVYHLPVWAAILGLLIGNVVGGVVMALHAAQGPQMGVPQMLQTRAQFGSYGSLLVVTIVVVMYTAFFASNMVLGGQALADLTSIGETPGIVLVGVLGVIGAIYGYRVIHAMAGVLSALAGLALVAAFVMLFAVVGLPAGTMSSGSFGWAGFMGTVSLAALWQIAYAPYVSDYTRYMPKDTGVRAAFWATYGGCVLGSLFPMLLGAFIGAAWPNADTVTGVHTAGGAIGAVVLAIFAISISATNAMNLYCGALSSLTIGQTLKPRWQPGAATRTAVCIVIFAVALVIALAGRGNFLENFENFMLLLLCVLIPWTAVNLVDYYLIRHGEYDIPSLFKPDGGVYGRINVPAVGCYLLGIAVQVPFLSNALFTGPVAKSLGGVDISWIVGLAIIAPTYYVWVRATTGSRERIAAEPVTTHGEHA